MGPDALQAIAGPDIKIDLLLTDLIMPGMTGRILADTLLARFPEIEIVFMSGHISDPRLVAIEPPLLRFIGNPSDRANCSPWSMKPSRKKNRSRRDESADRHYRRSFLSQEPGKPIAGDGAPLRQEPEAPTNNATSRDCLLATSFLLVPGREEALSTPGGGRGMPRRGIAIDSRAASRYAAATYFVRQGEIDHITSSRTVRGH